MKTRDERRLVLRIGTKSAKKEGEPGRREIAFASQIVKGSLARRKLRNKKRKKKRGEEEKEREEQRRVKSFGSDQKRRVHPLRDRGWTRQNVCTSNQRNKTKEETVAMTVYQKNRVSKAYTAGGEKEPRCVARQERTSSAKKGEWGEREDGKNTPVPNKLKDQMNESSEPREELRLRAQKGF